MIGVLAIVDAGRRFGASGYVVDSVTLALFAANRLSKMGFREVLRQLITVGGAPDTNAALAGQLMGASLGERSIDGDLVRRTPGLDSIRLIGRQLAQSMALLSESSGP